MMEYGYINENGYLVSREFDKEQVSCLDSAIWKPVDAIDSGKIKCEDGYHVKVVPFDNGDKISYHYNKVFDIQKLKNIIATKKQELVNGDYRIIKCYEASLVNASLPYDIEALHKEREQLRREINELETTIANA